MLCGEMSHAGNSCFQGAGDRKGRWFVLAVLPILFLACGSASGAGLNLEIVAQTGDPVPDRNGSLYIFDFPSINNSGQVAFDSHLSGTSGLGADDNGLFRTNGVVGIQPRPRGP